MAATATDLDRLVRKSFQSKREENPKRRLDHHTKRLVVAAIKLHNRSVNEMTPDELKDIFLDSRTSDLNAVEIKQLQKYLSTWNLERMV